jgi:hypothetical protein
MKLSNKNILLISVIATFALLLFVYSCASLQIPEPGKNTQSILIIPTVKVAGVTRSHFGKFELYVKGQKDRIMINPVYKYTIVTTLEPGDYEIYKIQPIYNNPRPQAKPLEVNIKFKILPGHITILSSALYWQMHSRGMYYGMDKFPDDEKMKLISELRTQKNFQLWILSS